MMQRIKGQGDIRSEDIESLKQRLDELSKIACDSSAFMKLKVENYTLREAEARLASQPRDTQEWEQKVQELNILIADYGMRFEKLVKRARARKAAESSLTSTPSRAPHENGPFTTPKSLSGTMNSMNYSAMLKTVDETTKKELFVMSPVATPRKVATSTTVAAAGTTTTTTTTTATTAPSAEQVAAMQEKDKRIADLEAEVEKLKHKAYELELELGTAKEKLQKAEYEAKSAQETIKKLDMTVEELKSGIDLSSAEKGKLEQMLQDSEARAADTVRVLKGKDEKIAELEKLIDASDSDAKAQIDSIRMERDVALEEKANAEFNKVQTNAEITLLREGNTRLTEQLESAKAQLAQLERKTAIERAEAQKTIRQKEQQITEKDEEINELLEAKRSLTNDLFKLQTDLTKKMSSSYLDDDDDDDDGDLNINLNDFGLEGLIAGTGDKSDDNDGDVGMK